MDVIPVDNHDNPNLVFAQQMVDKYQGLLLKVAGVHSVSVDGIPMTFNDLNKELLRWMRAVRAAKGKRNVGTITNVNLGGNWY
jgi:hypothetical protein